MYSRVLFTSDFTPRQFFSRISLRIEDFTDRVASRVSTSGGDAISRKEAETRKVLNMREHDFSGLSSWILPLSFKSFNFRVRMSPHDIFLQACLVHMFCYSLAETHSITSWKTLKGEMHSLCMLFIGQEIFGN